MSRRIMDFAGVQRKGAMRALRWPRVRPGRSWQDRAPAAADVGTTVCSTERLVAGLPEDVHHGLECEPLRDLLVAPEPPAELRAGEFGDLLALLFGLALLHIALLRPPM